MRKRILSLLLCVVMLFSLCPQSALAVGNGQAGGVTAGTSGLCEHHPEHNADCGYTEGTAGTPCVHEHTADCYEEVTNCVHEHDEDCYPEESVSGNEATPSNAQKREPENCLHICDEESGCITKELNCQHEHDDECGYSPATAGTPCGYVCELCGAGDNTPSNAEAVTVASVQAMIDGLPNAEEITEENAEEVEAQLEAIDEAKEKLSDEEIDELDITRYAEAAAALGALAAPMLLANDSPDEQFSLTPGSTYYFDLSGADIPGDKNGSLPDGSLHWVPFTYAGTVNAYVLKSRSANDNTARGDSANAAGSTDPDNPIGYTYDHSLFIADYNVTRSANWHNLNAKNLIFGKAYTSSGVDYPLRAPSAGSSGTASGGTPASNEWDAILDKANQSYQDNTVGYIKNWNGMDSWGQDTHDSLDSDWNRATRGSSTARSWQFDLQLSPTVGFRPVLELPSSDTLGSDGLKAITLDLNGGKIGGNSDDIQIIVKNGSAFTAPASGGLTRPDGDTGDFFMWLGSNGSLYAPGKSVPAGVTTLTAQFAVPSYTVTLNTNGGTINSGNVTGYTYGQGATLPTADDMTYTGHTFKGWYDNKALTGTPVTAISDTETGDKEYWAKWEVNTYTVTLNGVNSDATGAGNYAVGVTVNIYAGTKSGYSFNGWTSDNVTITNANNKNASFTMPAKDVTVTANWTKNSSGGTGHIYYTIRATAGEGGKITPSGNATVLYGRNKTFTITPDNGYAIADVKIDGQSIGAVKIYTFERVRGDHTIEAVFMKATGNPQTGVDVPFTDVSETDWFYADVAYVYANGLMAGTSVTTFSPNVTTTRGMIVTILYRLEGEPTISGTCPFDDVKSGSYYEKAIIWAAAKGIVSGYGSDLFGPDDPITREQMAVILFRYAQYKGLDVSAGEDTDILSYSDALDISEYAFPAMQWICGVSILNGSDGNLMPRGSATRAQVAAILHRFCENILK